MYGSVLASTSAPCSTACGGIPCVMSMIPASGAIRLITPWQVPTKSSWSPKSERNVMNTGRPESTSAPDGSPRQPPARPATAAARPALECSSASATTSRPACARGARRLRPDRDDREPRREGRERPGGRGGREEVDVGGRKIRGPELARPVERDDIGAERARQQAARALGRGEQARGRRVAGARRGAPPGSRRPGRGRRPRGPRPWPGRSPRAAAWCRSRGAAARARRSRS